METQLTHWKTHDRRTQWTHETECTLDVKMTPWV